jgi:hypothetical protein
MSAGLEPTTFGVFQRGPKTNALPLRQDTLLKADLIGLYHSTMYISSTPPMLQGFSACLIAPPFLPPSIIRASPANYFHKIFYMS